MNEKLSEKCIRVLSKWGVNLGHCARIQLHIHELQTYTNDNKDQLSVFVHEL